MHDRRRRQDEERRDAAAGPAPPAHPLLALQRAAGNQAVAGLVQRRRLARLVVTGKDPDADPMTAACVPFAEREGGQPTTKFVRGINYRPHRSVIYMGHGDPGGHLTDFDSAELVAELADKERGVLPHSKVMLWSCFASRPTDVSASLVERVSTALAAAGAHGVTVSGVPGALYTDTHRDKLFSGAEPGSVAKDHLGKVEMHAWAACGLSRPEQAMFRGQPTGAAKEIDVSIPSHPAPFKLMKGAPPFGMDGAIASLVATGKLAATPATLAEKKLAVQAAMQELYRIFFAHPITQYYIGTGEFKEGVPPTLVQIRTEVAAWVDSAEVRDPERDEYMRSRTDEI